MGECGGAAASFWQGERVRLRGVEPEDWAAFFAWGQDSDTARRSYAIPFPRSAEAARRWAVEQATSQPEGDDFRWVIANLAGEVVGTINTHSCDRRNGTFSYGLGVRREHWRKGYAAEAITIILRYFFQELRYQKCTVHIYDFNAPSLRLHERLGFQPEGRLRRMVFTEGRHADSLVYGLTAEEFAAGAS